MKKKHLGLLFVLTALCSCAVLGDRTVNVSEAQIQQKLNEKLAIPISLLKIFDVDLSNSIVKFDQSTGRMTTTMDTHLSSELLDKALTGKLGISGKLRFDMVTRSIVLDEPKIEQFNLDGASGQYNELLNALAKAVGGDLLNGLTLYTVKPEDLNIRGTQYNPKNMQITDKGLQLTLSPTR
ncbi:MAG: DUF1439 domain-containing protein [Methylophilaceae bacterium]